MRVEQHIWVVRDVSHTGVIQHSYRRHDFVDRNRSLIVSPIDGLQLKYDSITRLRKSLDSGKNLSLEGDGVRCLFHIRHRHDRREVVVRE